MEWIILASASFLEIGFAKWSAGFTRLLPALFTAATGLSSVFLLSLALRTLPVGTGYAVWTGIGVIIWQEENWDSTTCRLASVQLLE